MFTRAEEASQATNYMFSRLHLWYIVWSSKEHVHLLCVPMFPGVCSSILGTEESILISGVLISEMS